MKTLPILVNSCDKFRDCWDPFFILWKKFGLQKIEHQLFLNTERADYHFDGLNITVCKVCERNHWQGSSFPSWSWCTRKAVEQMEGDFFLYMQEDYYLDRPLDEDFIAELLQRMEEDSSIHNIHLTDHGLGYFIETDKEGLKKGDPVRSCYASLQAVIWRRDVFLSLLRDEEDAWDFEHWGSQRARLTGLNFYRPEARAPHAMPMSYIATGVIQGKWFRPCVKLFQEQGIEVDFSVRGFFEDKRTSPGWSMARIKRGLKARFAGYKRHFLPLSSLLEIRQLKKQRSH